MATTLKDIIEHLQAELNGKTPVDRLRQEFGSFESTIHLPPEDIKKAVGVFKAFAGQNDMKKAEQELIDSIRKHANGLDPSVEIKTPPVVDHPHFSSKVRENIRNSTRFENGMRATSAGLGAVLLGKAIMVDLKKDEDNNKHPLLAIMDGSAGAALIATSLLTRGSRIPTLYRFNRYFQPERSSLSAAPKTRDF